MRDDTQRTDHTQHTQDFKGWDVSVAQHHINDGGRDDEEIESVPTVAQVGAFVHSKAEGNKFQYEFNNEKVIEDEIQLVAEDYKLVILRQANKVRLECKLGRRQRNEEHDKVFKPLVLLDKVDVSAEATLSMEQVDRIISFDIFLN